MAMLLCRGSDLYPMCADASIRKQWVLFVHSVGDALLGHSLASSQHPAILNLDVSQLSLLPFQQADFGDDKLKTLQTLLNPPV